MNDRLSWKHVSEAAAEPIYPGIHRRRLWRGSNGAHAMIVEIAPGHKFLELDVHEPGPEEVYVISGIFNDGVRDYPAGSFIHCPAGSSHIPQSTTGCVLFLFYPEG